MSNIPKLRFKEFSGEWKIEKFGELTEFQQGVQVDVELQSKEPKNGYIKFLRIENYTQNSQDLRYIPNDLAKNKTISENEIAVVRYGATAGFIGRGFNGVLANNLFKLVPNSSILDTEYLFQYLKSHKVFSFFQSEMSGGAMPALSFGIVQVLKIPYPSILEQQKVASFLSVVDTKIDQLIRKKELLEEYKKGAMRELFSQELRFKDDNENEFPEWEEKKLGEVLESIPTKKYQIKTSEIKDFGKYLVVDQGQDLIAGFSDEVEMLFTNHPVVVFGDHTTVLKYIDYEFIIGADGTKVLKCKKDHPKYVFYNLGFNNVQQEGYKRHFTMLSEIYLQIPSLAEQTKIANFLSAIDTKIDLVVKQLDVVKNFKKGLLQQMFV